MTQPAWLAIKVNDPQTGALPPLGRFQLHLALCQHAGLGLGAQCCPQNVANQSPILSVEKVGSVILDERRWCHRRVQSVVAQLLRGDGLAMRTMTKQLGRPCQCVGQNAAHASHQRRLHRVVTLREQWVVKPLLLPVFIANLCAREKSPREDRNSKPPHTGHP